MKTSIVIRSLACVFAFAASAVHAAPTVFYPRAGDPSVMRGSITAIGGMNYVASDESLQVRRADVDADATTFDSSSDKLRLPLGATVRYALLYVSQASYVGMPLPAPPRYPIDTVANTTFGLRTPDGELHAVTPDSVAHRTIDAGSNTAEHAAWADVTALVAPFAGGGTFTVSNIAAQSMDNLWVLYVVYEAPTEPLRNIRLWNIDAFVWGHLGVFLSSFELTGAPTPSQTRGLFIAHGSNGQLNYKDGEFIRVDGVSLTDSLNPSGEVWNSSRSEFGVQAPFANPPPITVYDPALRGGGFVGLDLDLFHVDNALTPNTSTHVVELGTTGVELFYLHTAALAIEVIAPELTFTKTMSPLVSGPIAVGDELEVTIGVQDAGSDDALAVSVMDALPDGIDYVANTLEVVQASGTASPTDGVGDDIAEYDSATRTLHFRLGVGASATSGGTLPIGAAATIRFRVVVATTFTAPGTIVNESVARFVGALAPESPILVRSSDAVDVEGGECSEPCPYPVVFGSIDDANGTPVGSIRGELRPEGPVCDHEPDGTLTVHLGLFYCE